MNFHQLQSPMQLDISREMHLDEPDDDMLKYAGKVEYVTHYFQEFNFITF